MKIISDGKALGARTVVFCGDGEPTMDRNIVQMLAHTKQNDMIMVIVTNGVIFGDDNLCKKVHGMTGREFLELIYDNDAILILKLESLKEEKYDYIVGVKGSFKNS